MKSLGGANVFFDLGPNHSFVVGPADGPQRAYALPDQPGDGEDLPRGDAGKEPMVANCGQSHAGDAAAL